MSSSRGSTETVAAASERHSILCAALQAGLLADSMAISEGVAE